MGGLSEDPIESLTQLVHDVLYPNAVATFRVSVRWLEFSTFKGKGLTMTKLSCLLAAAALTIGFAAITIVTPTLAKDAPKEGLTKTVKSDDGKSKEVADRDKDKDKDKDRDKDKDKDHGEHREKSEH
jgi:hypothetical protein